MTSESDGPEVVVRDVFWDEDCDGSVPSVAGATSAGANSVELEPRNTSDGWEVGGTGVIDDDMGSGYGDASVVAAGVSISEWSIDEYAEGEVGLSTLGN
jgi:hypothetical protein